MKIPSGRRVLDPCCGTRMFWFDKRNADAIFGDIRRENLSIKDRSHGKKDGQRVLNIEPDFLMDFRALPFADASFSLVSFDPPHLVRVVNRSWLAAKYGKLSKCWQDDISRGFNECFRVLSADGVLIFKWNETQIKLGEVISLCKVKPLFGHISGRKGLTHWLVFQKPKVSA